MINNNQIMVKLKDICFWITLMIVLFLILSIYYNNKIEENKIKSAIITDEENSNVIIDVPELGQLRGFKDYTSWTNQVFFNFLKVPYAEPPIGRYRFKPPFPISKWHGIKDAKKLGKQCPAYKPLEKQKFNSLSEDCLNLCIYTKDFRAKRPVMVYIHGNFFRNDSDVIEHSGHFLLEKDIVFVAIQYRVGVLGFISTQTLDIPGNMGILDVKLALEWIHENIEYFGGNPDDVTVFGQSEGAIVISLLMISPLISQNLFQKAILQSGTILLKDVVDIDVLENTRELCKKLGCKSYKNVTDINNCVKRTKLFDLLKAENELPDLQFGLTINDFGGVVPKKPKQLLMESDKKYQVMAGVMQNDGSFGINDLFPNITLPTSNGLMFITSKKYIEGNTDTIKISKLIVNQQALSAIIDNLSTTLVKSPIQKFMELYSKKYSNQRNYLYTMDYAGQHAYLPQMDILKKIFPFYPFVGGVHHADDLLYLFPTKDLNEEDTEMAKTMIDLWTSFAINGKPEVENGPKLLPIKNGKGPYFHINKKITIDDDFLKEFAATMKKLKNL